MPDSEPARCGVAFACGIAGRIHRRYSSVFIAVLGAMAFGVNPEKRSR